MKYDAIIIGSGQGGTPLADVGDPPSRYDLEHLLILLGPKAC